jgi:histidyl-tRNA synthetase
MKKQFDYANKKNIRLVAVVGESEMQGNKVSVKNMVTGEQVDVPTAQLVNHILDAGL